MSNYVVLSLNVLIMTLLLNKPLSSKAFATSPSFPRQVITDASHDWDASPLDNASDCKGISHAIPIADLESVSYFSDGKNLNATLWLSAPFEEKPSPSWRSPSYSMFIHINSFYETNIPDYEVTIKWDPFSSSWTRQILEWSSNDTRVLAEKDNYTGFFDNNPEGSGKAKSRVNLSFNLASINSPDKYIGFFRISDVIIKGNDHCLINDDSDNAMYVPIPEFTVSTSPSSVELRPGEEKDVELKVNSTIHSTPRIAFSTNQTRGIQLDLIPKEEFLTPAAMTASFLHVKVLQNATFRYNVPYTIQILPNVSFPKIDSNLVKGKSNKMSATIPIPRSYLTITILPSLTLPEQIKNTWETWGSPISGFYTLIAAIAAGISPLIIRRIRQERKKKDKQQQQKRLE
jgi:hypothetical protein